MGRFHHDPSPSAGPHSGPAHGGGRAAGAHLHLFQDRHGSLPGWLLLHGELLLDVQDFAKLLMDKFTISNDKTRGCAGFESDVDDSTNGFSSVKQDIVDEINVKLPGGSRTRTSVSRREKTFSQGVRTRLTPPSCCSSSLMDLRLTKQLQKQRQRLPLQRES